MRQLLYQVCYTKYHIPFYLWLIRSAQKDLHKSSNDKIVKQKCVIDQTSRNAEVINIPAQKREEILNELRQVLQK